VKITRNIFRRLITKIYLTIIVKTCSQKFIFRYVYHFNLWGNNESRSGDGSTLKYTENIRKDLPILFEKYGIKTVLDAPCGDFNWFNEILKKSSIEVTGIDILPAIVKKNNKKYRNNKKVNFLQKNLVTYKYKPYDLVFCRDFLFHLSFNDTYKFLENFINSNSKFLLTTSHSNVLSNTDIASGLFRYIDLFQAPYFFRFEDNERIKDFAVPDRERYLFLFSRTQVIHALTNQADFFKEK